MAKILVYTPNINFTGKRLGVAFKRGVGAAPDQKTADYLVRQRGYSLKPFTAKKDPSTKAQGDKPKKATKKKAAAKKPAPPKPEAKKPDADPPVPDDKPAKPVKED